ncbi:MAG TPA: PKD domain-containing protein [Planctomycetota bacterium]|nr:PKD domain-containing protein [Planctomycetota bacterium]
MRLNATLAATGFALFSTTLAAAVTDLTATPVGAYLGDHLRVGSSPGLGIAFTDPAAQAGDVYAVSVTWEDGVVSNASAALDASLRAGVTVTGPAYATAGVRSALVGVIDGDGVAAQTATALRVFALPTAGRPQPVTTPRAGLAFAVHVPYADPDAGALAATQFSAPASSWTTSGGVATGEFRSWTRVGGGFRVTSMLPVAGDFTASLAFAAPGCDGHVVARGAVVVVPNNAPAISDLVVSPQGVVLGGDASLTALLDDADGDRLVMTLDFGDGSAPITVSNLSVPARISRTYRYAAVGDYSLSLTVRDPAGASVTRTALVNVRPANRPPVIGSVAATPEIGSYRSAFALALAAVDADGDALRARVSWGDGATDEIALADGAAAFAHAYAAPGSFRATIDVIDARGAEAVPAIVDLVAHNASPVVGDLAATPGAPRAGDAVALAAAVEDLDPGDVLVARWDFGDGSPIAESAVVDGIAAITHVFAARGDYPVTLVVADALDATAASALALTVTGRPPTVADLVVSPDAPLAGTVAALSAVIGDPDAADTVLRARWDFGDGAIRDEDVPVGEVSASHAYAAPGAYVVALEVVDGGGLCARVARTVTIVGHAPVIASMRAPTAPVLIHDLVAVSVAWSDADAGEAHQVAWSWGDGSVGSASAEEGVVHGGHRYAAPGVYTVTATIVDASGMAAVASGNVVVYDPDGGFATGAGLIASPPGAWRGAVRDDLALFGFVAHYRAGESRPRGQMRFALLDARIVMRSRVLDWLVVRGDEAWIQGTATINGTGDYGFLMHAVEGGRGDGGLRMTVWSRADGRVVYDSAGLGEEDPATTRTLGLGAVVLHQVPHANG